ncbi:Rrf2 family transcriptional regulator [Acidiferrimicrobium sp. IK]|uniref:RrF2 family transcriptional regulator n=1 Tax=Acidiferrimicrobium sp. IK TaxID=2871700 RepID=UPI0021CB356C|nr:Rrf2 family transcriptional regulator [Acidiferrimicrobium sp. IK]MCU4185092.1 Rrf2 family transcriptional regulator [Acidiferrimicrobium sp. IK]
MQISAKADYAARALIELADAGGGPVKGERLASSQGIPPKFLESILAQLRQQGILASRRGADGGYWLARPAERITLADVMRATDGPLASVHGYRPEDVSYKGSAIRLSEVWLALRASLRSVLENVTIADLARGPLPEAVTQMLAQPGARESR